MFSSSSWRAKMCFSSCWIKSKSSVFLMDSMLMCFSAPGPHVFLLFISLSKWSEVEKKSARRLEEIFGPNVGRHSMVVFTHEGLNGATMEEVLAKDLGLQELVARCNGQHHFFNTLRGDQALAHELLPKILHIVQKNRGGYYTNQMYEEWTNQPKENKERQEEVMRRRASLRMHAFREYYQEREKEAQRKEEEEKKEKQRAEERRWLMEEVRSLKEAMKEIIRKGRKKEALSKEEEEEGEKQKKEKQREEKQREEWRRKKELMEQLIKIEQERIKQAQRREEEERQKRNKKIVKRLIEEELEEEREALKKLPQKTACSLL